MTRIFYDANQPVGHVEGTGEEAVRFVDPDVYFRAQVRSVMNVLAVFLNVSPANGLPESTQRLADDAIADEYWNRLGGCLIPPRLLRTISEATRVTPLLPEVIERARTGILRKDLPFQEAIAARVAHRVEILRLGVDGILRDRALSVAEAMTDVFLVQRAIMEDVLIAERERKNGQTRAAVIEQLDADEALVFETSLPLVINQEMILKAIPGSMMPAVERLAASRSRDYESGVFFS